MRPQQHIVPRGTPLTNAQIELLLADCILNQCFWEHERIMLRIERACAADADDKRRAAARQCFYDLACALEQHDLGRAGARRNELATLIVISDTEAQLELSGGDVNHEGTKDTKEGEQEDGISPMANAKADGFTCAHCDEVCESFLAMQEHLTAHTPRLGRVTGLTVEPLPTGDEPDEIGHGDEVPFVQKVQLQCSECVSHGTVSGRDSQELQTKVRELGWRIGSNGGADLCPQCVSELVGEAVPA